MEELITPLLNFARKEGWDLKEDTMVNGNRTLIFFIKQKSLSGFFSTSVSPNKITILISSSNGKILAKYRSELFGKRFLFNLLEMPLWGVILWAKDMAFVRENTIKLTSFLKELSSSS